jgi:hypothetical protein
MIGDNCKALVVYTGDLAQISSSKVTKAFIDKFCTQHYTDHRKMSNTSSNSSVSSQKSGDNYQYLSQIIKNVLEIAGYKWLAKFVQR